MRSSRKKAIKEHVLFVRGRSAEGEGERPERSNHRKRSEAARGGGDLI